MADVLNRTDGATFPYSKTLLFSVNEPDYPQVDWIWNPDLSAVQGFNSIYWDITGDSVVLVDQATRDARDAELAAVALTNKRESLKARYDTEDLLKAFADVMIDEINILRQQHALADRTAAQLRTALRNKLDQVT